MTNIVNTNNQNLRLSALSVGLRSTLRLAFPNIPTEATRVEIIVTNEIAVSYSATWNVETNVWECDVPASQFMKVGKQKYEVAYLLDGEQFWDGQGWIEIVKATTQGILPNPETNTTRYYITSINGVYGATEQDGNVRIPALYTGAALPPVAEHIENDQFFNTVNNSLYVLADGEWKSVAGSGGGGSVNLSISTTWGNLVAVRNAGELVTGCVYRITDYVATTVQEHTQSANHPFDIIVTADSPNKLNEVARAIRHEGDTYFPETTKFEAWQIWYSLDNDTNRFEWADEASGKGVIYRLIDEFNNDVPYDFKGIKMRAYLGYDESIGDNLYSEDYRYTFGVGADDTLQGGCYENVIKSFDASDGRFSIVRNTFGSNCSNNFLDLNCNDNTFGSGCDRNILGAYCIINEFGNNCRDNVLGFDCYSNIFESGCRSNTFGSECHDNTLGNSCNFNVFGSTCIHNTLSSECDYNTFGLNCTDNTFGSGCNTNIFGTYCSYNNFGFYCESISFGPYCGGNILFDFFSAVVLQNSVSENSIDCIKDRGDFEFCQNIEVKSGVFSKEINIDDAAQSYHTEVRPENSITITI